MKNQCTECGCHLNEAVSQYSQETFNTPLCVYHQNWIRNSDSSSHAKSLYLELKKIGVPAKLEKYDGFKTIDIAIPECKVNIEVDGIQHNSNPDQALSDLKRTYYSFLKGYITLRVPNSLIERNIEAAIDYIVRFLNANNNR